MTDASSTRIGRYELRERLGAGGMARVYKAWDTTLQRLVAIKILHEHLAEDPNFKERFEREARMVASFNHPNIVQLYDFDSVTLNGFLQYYMVMSYVPGTTLRRELDNRASAERGLPLERVRTIAEDLSAALGYAHVRGMVHRDVKPGNVLIDENGRAILTDFGIARMAQSTRLTQDGSSTGTPAYMSPEQASGLAGDARSDLYALGVIQFELLTGEPPYTDEGSMAVMMKHVTAEIPLYSARAAAPNLALDRYFERALAKSPDGRFQNADEQERAFLGALEGTMPDPAPADTSQTLVVTAPAIAAPATTEPSASTSAVPPHSGVFNTLTQSVRRNPRASGGFAIMAALIVLLLVIVLGVSRVTQPPSPSPTLNASAVRSVTGENYFYTRFRNEDPATSYWPQESEPPFTHAIENDVYRVSTDLPFTAETVLYTGGDAYDNVLVYLDGKLGPDSAPASAFGIVFRYQDADNYNVFAVDGEGRFSIWTRQDGEWRELRNDPNGPWTKGEAIRPIGETNVLTLEVRGDQFTGFVNSERVVQVTDATFGPGRIGLYIGSDDGASTALIDEYRVRAVTTSMTGP